MLLVMFSNSGGSDRNEECSDGALEKIQDCANFLSTFIVLIEKDIPSVGLKRQYIANIVSYELANNIQNRRMAWCGPLKES